jgi:uncharacterized protein YceH (UPF0502 family)
MYRFEALEDVHTTLDKLSQREPSLVAVLPRQPGTKESRYMHLLSGQPEFVSSAQPSAHASVPEFPSADSERIARLEAEVLSLREELADMQRQLAEFRKQFE